MKEYVSQHSVPVSYLQFFASDGNPRGHETPTWVATGDKARESSVRRVAVADYTYSRKRAKEVETAWGPIEGDYASAIRRIATAPYHLPRRDKLTLLLFAFDLHVRNVQYQIPTDTGVERADIYERWSTNLLVSELGVEPHRRSIEENCTALMTEWAIRIVTVDGNLWTSDNPSVFFADDDGPLALILLPLSPHIAGVFYRRASLRLTSRRGTTDDADRMNELVVARSHREVYAASRFDLADLPKIEKGRNNSARTHRANLEQMEFATIKLSNAVDRLSFIERRAGVGGLEHADPGERK